MDFHLARVDDKAKSQMEMAMGDFGQWTVRIAELGAKLDCNPLSLKFGL